MSGSSGVLARIATALGRIGPRRPRLTLLLAGALAVLALALASQIRFDPDVLAAAPDGVPELEDLVAVSSRFGSLDRLVVAVEADDGGGELAAQVAGELAAWLAVHPGIERLETALPPLVEVVAALRPFVPALTAPAEAERLAAATAPAELRARAQQLRLRLASPAGLVAEPLALLDPFGFATPAIEAFGGANRPGGARALASGALESPDGRFVVVVARPRTGARDIKAARALIDDIRAKAGTVAQEAALDGPAPRVGFAGAHALAAEDSGRIAGDLARTTSVALLAVAVVFAIGFRGPRDLLAAVVPLLLGIAVAWGLVAAFFDDLSVAAAAAAALVLGLGIDYGIVLLGRVGEEIEAGREPRLAVTIALATAGPGVMVGAITTLATFACFFAAGFQGLRDLGLLVALGVLCSLAAVLILVPVLAGTVRARRVGLRWILGLIEAALRSPARTVLVWSVGLVLAVLAWPRLGFDDSLGALRALDSPAAVLQRELSASFGLDLAGMVLGVNAADEEELLRRLFEVRRSLEPLIGEEIVAATSLANWLPPLELQQASLAAFLRVGAHPELEANARSALLDAGFAAAPFEAVVADWAGALRAPRVLRPSDLQSTTLAPMLSSLFLVTAEGVSAPVFLALPPQRYRSEPPPQLAELVERQGLGRLAGLNLVSSALRREIRRDLLVCGLLALFVTAVVLSVGVGRPVAAMIAFAPVVPALFAVVALASYGGVRFSFISLFAVVMLIGIGVDYGIHMVHRWITLGPEPSQTRASLELAGTGRAVVLAAGTTLGGFGALAFSSFPGLRAVGLFAAAGAAAAALAALTLVPALLVLVLRHQSPPARR